MTTLNYPIFLQLPFHAEAAFYVNQKRVIEKRASGAISPRVKISTACSSAYTIYIVYAEELICIGREKK